MNAKQKRTLEAIFSKPTKANILWADIEKLIISLGGEIKEGKGSAGAFIFKGSVFSFHRPHPQKEAKRYQIELIRKFLLSKEVGL